MYKLCAALLFAGATLAGPVAEPTHHRGYETKCHIVYDVAHSQKCNTYHEEVCHEEYDVIVDTTYIEECADIVTQHCSETHQEVHHSSAVVGHDDQIIHGGHHGGYAKREAEAEPGYGYQPHNNLQCFSKPHKQCHQKPIQNQRQECHEEYDVIVDTTYIEECQDIVTQHCQEVHKQVHHSSAVVGHDSHVVSHGHSGHGKREAEADPGHHGYSSGPQCQQHVEKQCHKVPQHHERKVPRKECKSVPKEQCHPVAHKVPRKVCATYEYGKGHGHGHGGHGHGHGHHGK